MRTASVFIWGIVLFVFTCAFNSKFWETGQIPTFHWIPNPDFHALLKTNLTLSISNIIQKVGHFSGFAVLAFLLYRCNNSVWKSFILSVTYAILTELLQLYFGRDGRIYDIVIDTAGVFVALSLVWITKLINQKVGINH